MKNTKELKRFKLRDDASKHAKNVNDILSDIGDSLDKFAFTRYDRNSKEYVVNIIFGQHPGAEDRRMVKKKFLLIDPLGMRISCNRKRIADAICYARKYGGTIIKTASGYEITPNGGNKVQFLED